MHARLKSVGHDQTYTVDTAQARVAELEAENDQLRGTLDCVERRAERTIAPAPLSAEECFDLLQQVRVDVRCCKAELREMKTGHRADAETQS